MVDGEEIIEEVRECDDDPVEEKEYEIPKIEESSRDIEDTINKDETVIDNKIDSGTFFNIDSSKETYGTFIVYIIRKNETINSILEKYETTIEDIEKYNDIKDLSLGKKLIIPLLKKDEQ